MSKKDKKEDLISALERISELSESPEVTDLCFTISGIVLTDKAEEATSCVEKGECSTSAFAPNPSAKPFVPQKVAQEGDHKGKAKLYWEPVPCLVTPVSKAAPTFSQVVGCMPPVDPITPEVGPGVRRRVTGAALSSQTLVDSMSGGAQGPYQYTTADQWTAVWDNAATDHAKQALEAQALARGNTDVKLAALLKRDERSAALIQSLTTQVTAANNAANAANNAATQAQAVATAAGNADRFRPAAPPKFGNKKKDPDVRQWLPVVEDYLKSAPDADYLRLASSYLEGGPRSVWTTKYEAYKSQHANAEPPQPRQFFKTTLEDIYGLDDLNQRHWDTWNSLRQLPGQDITEYNVAFQSALTDLAAHITDEQIKIERYRTGLQFDLKELCRVSPSGARWTSLQALVQYATLQWPVISARVAKKQVAGKRKGGSGGGSGGSGSGRSSSKAKLGAGKLTDEDRKHNMENHLCHRCRKPGHQYKDCPLGKTSVPKAKSKAGAASGSAPVADAMEEDF